MLWESQESQDRLRAAGGTQVVNPTNGKRTWLVQRNVRASSEVREHTIMWTNTDMEPQSEEDGETGRGWGTGFVRSLVGGDRIVLLIRALVRCLIGIDASSGLTPVRSIRAGQIMYWPVRSKCSTPSKRQVVHSPHGILGLVFNFSLQVLCYCSFFVVPHAGTGIMWMSNYVYT